MRKEFSSLGSGCAREAFDSIYTVESDPFS
jgi:hypothetical protein